jgi:hypothetical protein
MPSNARVEPPRAGSRSAPQAQNDLTRLRRAESLTNRPARTRCYVASQLVLADVQCSMKHAEDVDIPVVPHQVGDTVVAVEHDADMSLG